MTSSNGGRTRRDLVPLREAALAWFQVSLQSFGGPAGQIAVMHRELVDERRWVGERRFLHALSYCTLLPGPEAQQLAIYLGWLLNGTLGGLIAGSLFVLPGYVAIMGLSVLYAGWGDTQLVGALFAGVAPAVLAIVAQAVVRISRRALRERVHVALAIGAFLALAAFAVPFPVVVAGAGTLGGLLLRQREGPADHVGGDDRPGDRSDPLIRDADLHEEGRSPGRALRIIGIGLLVWIVPLLALGLALGADHVFVEQGRFFSGAALVTFGGAYAVLTYVAQQAVEVHGWLAPGEMVTGLAMAESTPGPLIQVVQFVGFLGAYRDPGSLSPWLAGALGATLVTWVTYVPCFLFIFVGAPHVEALRHNRRIAAVLTGITTAVVGVIANLGLYLAIHTLFSRTDDVRFGPLHLEVPDVSTIEARPVLVAGLAVLLLFRFRWSVLKTLAACVLVGGTIHLLGR
ncbi:MAG: chromate efflux transporter [Actinomycetota bacterium]|nr:chromate efflux transporter [Actinomycetota bacterium]